MTERIVYAYPVEAVETLMRTRTEASIVWHHCDCGCGGHIAFARDDKALWICGSISGDPGLKIIGIPTPAALERFLENANNGTIRLLARGLFPKAGSA